MKPMWHPSPKQVKQLESQKANRIGEKKFNRRWLLLTLIILGLEYLCVGNWQDLLNPKIGLLAAMIITAVLSWMFWMD